MKVFNIILPVVLLIIGLFTTITVFLLIVLLYITLLYFTNREALFRLKSKFFLGFITIMITIYPLFGEKTDLLLPFNIAYDFNYLEMSVKMSLRAILLFGFSNNLLSSISASNILSKFSIAQSEQIVNIAMDNYDKIARVTTEHFKNIRSKNYKFNRTIDYIANFMAEILSIDLSKKE